MARQNAFDRVRQLGDAGLLDHASCTLERVRQAQQASDDVGRGSALLVLQDSLHQSVEELARLDAKVLVGVFRHSPTRSPAAESAASGPEKGR